MDDATNAELTELIRKKLSSGSVTIGQLVRDAITGRMHRSPYWYSAALFAVAADAVATLEHSIEDPTDSTISWDNPWLTAEFAVSEADGLFGVRTIRWEPATTAAELLRQFAPLMWDFFRNVALADMTHHLLIVRHSDEHYGVVTPANLRRALSFVPDVDRPQVIEQLSTGHWVGAQDTLPDLPVDVGSDAQADGIFVNAFDEPDALHIRVGARGVQNQPVAEHLLKLVQDNPLPSIKFAGTAQGRPYTGAVIFRFEPLSRTTNDEHIFPVTVGLAFYPSFRPGDAEPIYTDPATWNARERGALLRGLFRYLENSFLVLLDAKEPPSDPEVAARFASRTTAALEQLGSKECVMPTPLEPPGVEGVIRHITAFFDIWRTRTITGHVVPQELQQIEARFIEHAQTLVPLCSRHAVDLRSILSMLVKHRLYWRFASAWPAFTNQKGLSAEDVAKRASILRQAASILRDSVGLLNGEWWAALQTCRAAGLLSSDAEDMRLEKLVKAEWEQEIERRGLNDPALADRALEEGLTDWIAKHPNAGLAQVDTAIDDVMREAGDALERQLKQWMETQLCGRVEEDMTIFELGPSLRLDPDDIGAIPQRLEDAALVVERAAATYARFNWRDSFDEDNGRQFFGPGARPRMVVEAACAHELTSYFLRTLSRPMRAWTAKLIMMTFPETTAGWARDGRDPRDALKQLMESHPPAWGYNSPR